MFTAITGLLLPGGGPRNSLGWGSQNAKNYFLLCCSPVKSRDIEYLLPRIFSILTQNCDTLVFSPAQPGPAPARPCPAQVRLVPSPALRAKATPDPAPALPGPARPSSAGARRQIHLGRGSQNAKNYFLLCCSPVKSQLIDILLPHIFSILTQNFDTWRFSPVQPGPAPARPCPAQVRLIPSPALRAQATPGPAPARPSPARPSSAGARCQIHLGLGSQNAKHFFLVICLD